jgi:hypothetical protein
MLRNAYPFTSFTGIEATGIDVDLRKTTPDGPWMGDEEELQIAVPERAGWTFSLSLGRPQP